jgi:rhamnosyltransferase
VISVIVPVRNGGADFKRLLESLNGQEVEPAVELIVVDSSSTDGSAEIAREHGARVETIPASEFTHGGTRNLAAGMAAGETLVFTSQDAYPERSDWLARLIAPLDEDPELAGVYGRQLPHHDAHPPERFFLDFLYGERARIQRARTRSDLSMDSALFSNVNAAIRREVWERFPFADDIIMSEDVEWAARVLLAGYSVRYEPDAPVRHSHFYTVASAFRRFFDSGVSAERAYLAGGRRSARVLRRRAFNYGREEIAWLIREGQARWIPYAAVYELSKYAGLQLGAHYRLLPVTVARRLSAAPRYWDTHGGAAPPLPDRESAKR